MNERLGAVNWVEYPHEIRIASLAAIFFANDTVLWVALGKDFANPFLGILVGQRYWCLVGLTLDFDIWPVVWQDLFGSLLAKVGNEFNEFVFLGACEL